MSAQDLFNGAAQIRDERKAGANSAERVGNFLTELTTYVVDNRRALNGDRNFADALSYPYVSVYIEDTGDDWQRLNDQLGLIDAVVMNKYNGNCRFFVSGVRVDVQNRALNNANKIVSQVAVGPLQIVGGKLAMANTADKTFRRIHNGGWSPWEEVIGMGKPGTATGAEVFNSYSGADANTATAEYAHAEGYKTTASAVSSHAEGDQTTAYAPMSHAEGVNNFVAARGGHIEGGDNRINSNDGATGRASCYAHAEGYQNEVGPLAPQAHIEGSTNYAGSANAHVEGYNNRIEDNARNAHAEGENNRTQPEANVSHIEGGDNQNNGASYTHIEGKGHVAAASATGGHVEGLNNTINNEAEHASGHWNLSTPGKTHFSVGIGSSSDRKNACEIDKQGYMYMLGVNGYNGKNADQSKSVQKFLENAGGSGVPSGDKNGYISDLSSVFSAVRNGGANKTSLGQWVFIPVRRVGSPDNGYCDFDLPSWAKSMAGYLSMNINGKQLDQCIVCPINAQIISSDYNGMRVRFSAFTGDFMTAFSLDYVFGGEGWCATASSLDYSESFISTGRDDLSFYLDEIISSYNKNISEAQNITSYVNIPFITNEFIGGSIINPGYIQGGLFGSFESGSDGQSAVPVGFQPIHTEATNGTYEITWMTGGSIYSLQITLALGSDAGSTTWHTVPRTLKTYKLSDIRPEGQPGARVIDLTRYIDASEDLDLDTPAQFINPSKDLASVVLTGYYHGNGLGARFESFPLHIRCDDSNGHRLIIEFDTYGGHKKLVFETSPDYGYIAKFLYSESNPT